MKVTELQEKGGSLKKQVRDILDKASDEKRELTVDEDTKLQGIEKDLERVEATLAAEMRQLARDSQKPVDLSRQEQRDMEKFDFAKLLGHLDRSMRGTSRDFDGIESEMAQEGEREARAAGVRSGGIFLPRSFVRRESRDMVAGTPTAGGNTIQTDKRGLLDDFFDASVMRQAGATVLEGLKNNLDLPRLTAGTAATKKAENAASDEVTPTTAMLSLTPNRLPAHIQISEQLLNQSSVAIEQILRGHLTTQMQATQEAAFFHGTGTSEAEGIAATSGIGSVAGGTNGLAPTWEHLVALRKSVQTNNALQGRIGYITNGDVEAKLATTPKVASTDSNMIINEFNGRLAGSVLHVSNAVSSTLTKGTSDSVASAIFFGNFADYVIGYWGGISLEMERGKTNAISGLYTLVASSYYDGGVVRPKSFAAMLDALAA